MATTLLYNLAATTVSGWFAENVALVLGGAIVLAALLFGLGDFARLSFSRIWAISGVVFAESIRRRVLWITPLAILGVIVVSQLTRPFDEQDAIRQTIKFCLFTTGLVVVIVAVLLACTSLPKEIENRVIYTIVTKPTTRLEIVLGKTLGFARVSATILLIMGVFTAGYLQLRSWTLRRDIAARLSSDAVDPISKPTLTYYRDNGLLHARTYSTRPQLQFYADLPAIDARERFFNAGGEHLAIVPFDLKPEMFDGADDGRIAYDVQLTAKAGWRAQPGTVWPPTEASATQPVEIVGPSPLLSSTRPSSSAPPAIHVQILDWDEATMVGDINNGLPIELPPRPMDGPFAFRVSLDGLNKLVSAARAADPRQRRVFLAILGQQPGFDYSIDADPGRIVILSQAAGSNEVKRQILEPAAAPIIRGGYSRFGQELKGDPTGKRVAVYHFRDAEPTSDGPVSFEFRAGIDRSGDDNASEEESATIVEAQIRNTRTGQLSAVQTVRPESNRTSFFTFPADAVAGGEFDLILRLTNPNHALGLRATGLNMVLDTGSFHWNLFKSLLIFWLLAVLVVAVAIFASTFLSWPIAVVLCVVMLLGRWGVDQLGDFSNIGPQFATETGLSDPRAVRVVSGSVNVLGAFLKTMVKALPDIANFPATEAIERGVSIDARTLWLSFKEMTLYGLPLLLLGYVILKNKEVAP